MKRQYKLWEKLIELNVHKIITVQDCFY